MFAEGGQFLLFGGGLEEDGCIVAQDACEDLGDKLVADGSWVMVMKREACHDYGDWE